MAYVYDGNLDFSGGANSGFLSHQIGKSQIFKGFNVSLENGAYRPRPSFIHREIRVLDSDGRYDYNHILKHGKFQAAIPYEISSGKYLLTIVCGIIFSIDLRNKTARIIQANTDDRLNQYHDRVHWAYAPGNESDVEIYDYPNQPIILDGLTARRSNIFRIGPGGVPLPETPAARLGVFAQTRLAAANGFDEFIVSDSTAVPGTPAPITFQETIVPGAGYTGDSFSLPAQKIASKITAMGYLSSANALSRVRSTKYGPLLVASKNMVAVFNTNLPRADWRNDASFGTIELDGLGFAGQRGHINLNADTLFTDQHGRIQSFAKAVAQESSVWTNFSLSKEISEFTWVPDESLHEFAVSAAMANKAFFSVSPYRTRARDLSNRIVYDYASRGIAVLELDNASTMLQDATPAWSGIWANVNPMEISVVGEEMYVWSKDCDGVNRLYQVDSSKMYDEFRGQTKKKVSRIYTRAFDHESFHAEKVEHSLSMILSDVRGDVNIKVERKRDGDTNFLPWDEKTLTGCEPKDGLLEFGEPADRAAGLGYHRNQIRTTIEGGSWCLEGIQIKSEVLAEPDGIGRSKPIGSECLIAEVPDLEIDSVCRMKG